MLLHLDSIFFSQHTKTQARKQAHLEEFKEFSAISNLKLSFLRKILTIDPEAEGVDFRSFKHSPRVQRFDSVIFGDGLTEL